MWHESMARSTAGTGSRAHLGPESILLPIMGVVNFFKFQTKPLTLPPNNSSHEQSEKQATIKFNYQTWPMITVCLFPFLIQWEEHSPIYYTGFIISRDFKMANQTEKHPLWGCRKCLGTLLHPRAPIKSLIFTVLWEGEANLPLLQNLMVESSAFPGC